LTKKGVKFIKNKVGSLKSFVNDYENFDIIFNCLGLGAIEFCDDKKLVSMRGQMIRVKAPWIKHFYYAEDDDMYIIPK
jgi:D-aspartate oxidase